MTAPASTPFRAGTHAENSIDDLDRRFRRPLMKYFEKRIRQSFDVDDLVQDVLIRLILRESLADIQHLEGYVFQVAANVIRDRIRRQAVRHAGDHAPLENCDLPTNDFSPERVLESRQLLDKALAALNELPVRTLEVFTLRLYEGLKLEEIARSLAMSVEGVRFHLRRAKAHLAKATEGRDL
jgi:RNA polymerase sigma-70 factor (ECF subfamily)